MPVSERCVKRSSVFPSDPSVAKLGRPGLLRGAAHSPQEASIPSTFSTGSQPRVLPVREKLLSQVEGQI